MAGIEQSDAQVAVTVRDNPELSRYEVYAADDLAGFTQYELGQDQIAFVHIETAPAFAGRGLAGRLVTAASTTSANGRSQSYRSVRTCGSSSPSTPSISTWFPPCGAQNSISSFMTKKVRNTVAPLPESRSVVSVMEPFDENLVPWLDQGLSHSGRCDACPRWAICGEKTHFRARTDRG